MLSHKGHAVTAELALLLLLVWDNIRWYGITESNSAYCDKCFHSVVCLSVCHLSHSYIPAKAVGGNEMPFGWDTHVVPSDIVLDRGPVPSWKGKIWESKPLVCSSATCRQITSPLRAVVMLVNHFKV